MTLHFDTCLLESVHTFEPNIECIAFSEPQGHRNRTVLPSKNHVAPNLAIVNSGKLKDEVCLVNWIKQLKSHWVIWNKAEKGHFASLMSSRSSGHTWLSLDSGDISCFYSHELHASHSIRHLYKHWIAINMSNLSAQIIDCNLIIFCISITQMFLVINGL